jgi:hypothetical protein
MRRVPRALVCAGLTALVALFAFVVGPEGIAAADLPLTAPTVTSIAPESGSVAGGAPVTIVGTGFPTGGVTVTVTIGGTEATEVSVVSETEITATTPAGSAGPGEVVVSDINGASTDGPFYTYEVPPPPPPPPPTVTSITPGFGPTAGGAAVTITGTGFLEGATVTIGGGEATEVHVVSETEITAETPGAVAGPDKVVVSDENGISTTGPAYTYVAPLVVPTVTLNAPASLSNDTTPSFAGSASATTKVTIEIYEGATATGPVISSAEATPAAGGGWTSGTANPALPSGRHTYTAVAVQEESSLIENVLGKSLPVTFTVDATPPQITLSSPANGSSTAASSQAISGSAGTAAGDQPAIAIQLFAGSATTGQALETIVVQASKGGWFATFGGLSPGVYTAQAEQRDDAGNIGHSTPVTFTLTAPVVVTPPETPPAHSPQPEAMPEQSPQPSTTPTQPAPAPATLPAASSPPAASFQWFPSAPHVGEPVSLVSTSTDATSPIAAFAWSLAGNGTFNSGPPVLNTSFSTPGGHVVQLRVTGADGLSSVVAETVPVIAPAPTLMQPFPVVRIAGSESVSGVKIGLLTVQAPVGATVDVTCRGPGCPAKAKDVVAASRKGKSTMGTALIAFRRFERSLRAGAILEIRISERGQIGKYTSFAVRRGKLPARVDTCLSPEGVEPVVCPSS